MQGAWRYVLFVLSVSIAVAIGYPLVKKLVVSAATKVGAKGVAAYESQG